MPQLWQRGVLVQGRIRARCRHRYSVSIARHNAAVAARSGCTTHRDSAALCLCLAVANSRSRISERKRKAASRTASGLDSCAHFCAERATAASCISRLPACPLAGAFIIVFMAPMVAGAQRWQHRTCDLLHAGKY